jgi:membrane protease YdiL (CAAX protease family)
MRCRPWLAILISALAFAAMHGYGLKMLGCTGFGILCGWLFWRTRSLLPSIAAHIINNGFCAIAIVSDKFFGSSEEYEPTPTLDVIFIIVCVPILYYSLRYLNRLIPREPAPQVAEPVTETAPKPAEE